MPRPLHYTRAAILFLALLAAGCGSSGEHPGSSVDPTTTSATARPPAIEWDYPPRPISGLRQRILGGGPDAAVLLWGAKEKVPPRDVVVFLHGYAPVPPWTYGDWLRHLADQGNTIVYPVYQGKATRPERFRQGALAGIRAGLRAAHADPASVAAVGVSTGGPLAFDYAALAAQEGLPPPRAVVAVWPGRNPPGGTITPADLSRIPAGTDLLAIAGVGDPIPGGESQARGMLAAATGVPARLRSFLRAPDANRYGPQEGDHPARRSFWVPADRVIAAARGGRGK